MTKRRSTPKPQAQPKSEKKPWVCQFCGAEGPSFYWRKMHLCPRTGPNIIRSK